MTYRIRVRDDAEGYDGYYRKHRGEFIGRIFDDRETAEDVVRVAPNGDCFEVVEVTSE